MSNTLYILGSCSGTEPQPNRHHVSFAIRHSGKLFWFDAGECCSYTAHLLGIDVRDIDSIFISHPHMDHIGGLGNLLWNIRKLESHERKCEGRTIHLFMPDEITWPALHTLLKQTEGGFNCDFTITDARIHDGVIYSTNGFTVAALHNTHLPPLEDGEYRSFSFLIECDGKRIVYSGDVGKYTEIEHLLKNADYLLAETGHHTPAQVCESLNSMGACPDKLIFIHHGRAILNHEAAAIDEAQSIYKGKIIVSSDGDFFEL